MTLWDIAAQWLKAHRRQRQPWMTAWPYRTKPARFNILQRYLIRRGLWIAVLLIVFKVNPLHPISLAVTCLGVTLMWTEHKTHRQQQRLLYGTKKKGLFG